MLKQLISNKLLSVHDVKQFGEEWMMNDADSEFPL